MTNTTYTSPVGKTVRDRKSGQKARNRENKLKRVEWQKEAARSGRDMMREFPWETCNGKKHRKYSTGKK